MFIIKNNYFLYIENTQSINVDCLKSNKKISIIYRNNGIQESLVKLSKFRNKCKIKRFKFYIANNSQAPMTLRVNALKVTPLDYQSLLGEAGIQSNLGEHSSSALILDEAVSVESLPNFEDGFINALVCDAIYTSAKNDSKWVQIVEY
jgi:16S rRNA C967 or C1407 C5-methylase (RsmB/RsmF family)